MHYTEIMVRYGELSTKGKNKKDFIKQLGRNVRAVCTHFQSSKSSHSGTDFTWPSMVKTIRRLSIV